MNTKFIFLSLLVSTLALSACAGGGGAKTPPPTASSIKPKLETSAIDNAMENALKQAEAGGSQQEILATLAQVHARNPKDPIVATRYGRALQADDQINAAERILEPFTKGASKNVEAVTEMAMVQLTLGNFKKAEVYAQQAKEIKPKNARAYLAMGTAQDALGRHQAAEISFREGLKNWQGDPAPIMNNLALNLASQGHLEESLAMIKKAQKLSPGRMELERNRRIIATLLETTGTPPPAPNKKPDARVSNNIAPSAAPIKPKPVAKKPAVKTKVKAEVKAKDNIEEKTEVKTEQVAAKKVEGAAEKTEERIYIPTETKSTLTNIKFKPLN